VFTIEAGEIILLHGFVKKSQRTPRKDLRIARRRNKLWKGRTE
jgi:phage-related protein